MSNQAVNYDIPADWSNDDVIEWLNATLAEPSVDHVELRRRQSGLTVRVVYVG